MESKFEHEPKSQFIFPDLRYEMGEIERTAKTYAPDNVQQFIHDFVVKAQKSSLVFLSEDIWSVLENTDSYDVQKGDWDFVNYAATENDRDWTSKREAIKAGKEMHAPIILKIGDAYHKVAGNTRLMVARCLGIIPKVLIVEMDAR